MVSEQYINYNRELIRIDYKRTFNNEFDIERFVTLLHSIDKIHLESLLSVFQLLT
jgi:hypothetical protein